MKIKLKVQQRKNKSNEMISTHEIKETGFSLVEEVKSIYVYDTHH